MVGSISMARARARLAYLGGGIPGVCERLAGSRVALAHIMRAFGARVGTGTIVYGHLQIVNPGDDLSRLSIGEQCSIGIDALIDLTGEVSVGDRAVLAMRSMILTHQDMSFSSLAERGYPRSVSATKVGDDAYIGAGAMVLAGCTIGERSIVAAGSVVTEDVPPDVVVGGVPAKVIKSL